MSIFIFIFAPEIKKNAFMEEPIINLPENKEGNYKGGQAIVRKIVDRMNIMQSNSVTFSRVALTRLQDNILTCIIDQLQDVLNGKRELDLDAFGQPYVTIDCDDAAGGEREKTHVKNALRNMANLQFQMKYMYNGKVQTTEGVIICCWTDIEGSNRLYIGLNAWAIPALIYTGKQIGGTLFCKNVSFQLKSVYSKRIYKFLCSQRNSKDEYHDIDICRFKEMFGVPESYTATNIRKRILEAAKDEIDSSDSDMTFDWESIQDQITPGKKKALAYIRIIPHHRATEEYDETKEQWAAVYHYILTSSKTPDEAAAAQATEALAKFGKLSEAYYKFKWMDDQQAQGAMTNHGARWTNSMVSNAIRKYVKDTLQAAAWGQDAEGMAKFQSIATIIAGALDANRRK